MRVVRQHQGIVGIERISFPEMLPGASPVADLLVMLCCTYMGLSQGRIERERLLKGFCSLGKPDLRG